VPCPIKKYSLGLLIALTIVLLIPSTGWSAASSAIPASYTVQSGDSLYGISKKFGLTVDEIVQLNNISNPNVIKPGMVLVLKAPTVASASVSVEPQSPTTYVVQAGDTLWSISRKVGVALADLLQINNLRDNTILHPGQTLLLESTQLAAGGASNATVPMSTTPIQPNESPMIATQTVTTPVVTPMGVVAVPVQVPTPATLSGTVATPQTTEPAPSPTEVSSSAQPTSSVTGVSSASNTTAPLAISTNVDRAREILERTTDPTVNMQWPVSGRLSSKFGSRWGKMHEGIDLAVPIGTPVRVAADGVIAFAGWSNGYGYLVKVNHGQGWETWYAHNSELRVAVGDIVLKGDVIARSGNTGNTTGPHVHFEIHKDGKVLDPLRYLP
jgi:murein DD-endopeptidase MepM/ murein hydrolase activator NlpD